MSVVDQMRDDWNRRAREDANYYVAFAREKQPDGEFLATGADAAPTFERELVRLEGGEGTARALEIGCGPGRLMLPMSRHFAEIRGVDISEEMVARAQKNLAEVPHARVLVNSGCDLRLFEDGEFHFVYSWIVFQHIPSKDVVLGYLREAHRVLKPGGILACQVRGMKPPDAELRPGWETWTGCWFDEAEILDFARAESFPLVSLWGGGTQYMFTVFRKARGPVESPSAPIVLKAVTAASGSTEPVPTRGRAAALSLWLDGFPENGSLADFPVLLGERLQTGCYLSPVGPFGGCQMNVVLPAGLVPGELPVRLSHRGTPVTAACPVPVVEAPPYAPFVVSVTDGVNLTAINRCECGGLRVLIEDVEDPAGVSFRVDGGRAPYTVVQCTEPVASAYLFTVPLPRSVPKGRRRLEVTAGQAELPAIDIEVA